MDSTELRLMNLYLIKIKYLLKMKFYLMVLQYLTYLIILLLVALFFAVTYGTF